MAELEELDENWQRALAIVAHPDDMEYGAASAVARWTSQGKQVAYLIVTDGEAGISDMAPDDVGPLRREEQRRSCDIVGVDQVEFMGLPDGLLEEGPELRKGLAEVIRRHRPEVLLSINHRDNFGPLSWNHVDHRVVGRSLLDAARDAGNPWVFTDLGPEPWDGVRWAAFGGSPEATHGVDVTGFLDTGIESLEAHGVYLEHLGGDMADARTFLTRGAKQTGHRLGVEHASAFELVYL
jgi:LmbE family N-acetylglucosaminyl deacetylase